VIVACEVLRLQEEKFRALPWLNWRGAIAALKAVLLRGCEVVFVVIAVGAGGGLLLPTGLGALAPMPPCFRAEER
jgi:Ca2+/H+ antiporter, TMEM165/GDT1 family